MLISDSVARRNTGRLRVRGRAATWWENSRGLVGAPGLFPSARGRSPQGTQTHIPTHECEHTSSPHTATHEGAMSAKPPKTSDGPWHWETVSEEEKKTVLRNNREANTVLKENRVGG